MAYDTFLTGEDELSRRMRPVYGSPPGGVSREQAASEDAAKRFARRRLLMGIQGGLGAGVEAGGGFLGNLLRGGTGALGGTLQANQMQHEEERQGLRDQAEAQERQRQYERYLSRDAMSFDQILNQRIQMRETERHNKATEGGGGGYKNELEFFLKDPGGYKAYKAAGRPVEQDEDLAMELDQPTLDMTALMYAKTGTLPPMGMGKAGAKVRTTILRHAAKNFPNLDVAANRADTQTNQAALGNLTKIHTAATAWKETVHKNADVMLKWLDKIPDTGTRFGNKISRYAASQLGSPEVAAFNTARETVKIEAARLLSSPGVGNAVLSDNARREVEALMSGDMTKAQMIRSLKVLLQDSENRTKAYEGEIGKVRAKLAWNQSGAGVAPAADNDPLGVR